MNRRLLLTLLSPILLAACGGGEAVTMYHVKGVVHKIKPEDQVLVIDHEEIPGYMRAMVMPFPVRNPAELEGLAPRDTIEFDYFITEDGDSWIENIKKTAP